MSADRLVFGANEGTALAVASIMAKTRKRSPAPPPPSANVPDPDRIARRAYELYQARGASDGGALEDWLAAEQEFNRQTPESRDE